MTRIFILLLALSALLACQRSRELALEPGMRLTHSVSIKPGDYLLPGADSLQLPVLTIEGQNITVDFNGATLRGTPDSLPPDHFKGLGILIKGHNITLKNARIRGYKVALMAEGCDSLKLLDCDLSYNWRPRLKSRREREDFSDWLSYHQNDRDEWLRYGAAAYLKNCNHALVKGLNVTGGMNGLLLSNCNDGLFYNNSIRFNSGVGMGLYRSNRNRIMHNRLDWNVRGYSHGFYHRGQDSAALLVYEQSNDNVFAYNSATHSGDGFFLWAGQTSMDSGQGGCNGNLIFRNDFSHAPTNGIEVTFSSNTVIGNKIRECTYGVWGGYSFQSLFWDNHIEDCQTGIAIEHGQDNAIWNNRFAHCETGIRLWERSKQPADWGYARAKDVSSRNYSIGGNSFQQVNKPLEISSSTNISISKDNVFEECGTVLTAISPNTHLRMGVPLERPPLPDTVAPLPDGLPTDFTEGELTGRQYILMDEWGPYDFRSPSVWLRNVEGNTYTFLLLGPTEGNWKAVDGKGWAKVNPVSGRFPATLICHKKPGAEWLSLDFEFIGQAFTDRFGRLNPRGKPFPFHFQRFEKPLKWQVKWYNYDEKTDPLLHYEAFRQLQTTPPIATEEKTELYYAWWGSPAAGIHADAFATFAQTQFNIAAGEYKFILSSDDGVRLYLDDRLIMEHWNSHEPATDEVQLQLEGQHSLRIEHFDSGGFATLDFRMEPVAQNQ